MSDRNIRLHFEGPKTSGHVLPAQYLVRALENIQQVVYLLAKQERGELLKQRARVSKEVEKTFALVCGLPESGGYALPQQIGDRSDENFSESEVETVSEKFAQLSRAIDSADLATVSRLVPSRLYYSAVLKRYKDAQPPKSSGLVLSIEDYKSNSLLRGENVLDKIKSLEDSVKTHELGETLGYLSGTLVKMDFIQKTFFLKLFSGRTISVSYQEDFEQTLLDNPGCLIQVHGNIQYGENNEPTVISDVDEIFQLDLAEIAIDKLNFPEFTVLVNPPLTFEIELDEDSGLLSVEGDFNVIVIAETRSLLEAEIEETLKMLWVEYADESEEHLSALAVEFSRELRSRLIKDGY